MHKFHRNWWNLPGNQDFWGEFKRKTSFHKKKNILAPKRKIPNFI